jgi:hypothetical protein
MILTKSEYISSINSLLADNSTQQISPEDLRTSLANLVDSVPSFLVNQKIVAANISTEDTRTTRVGELALDKMNLAGRSSVDNSAFGYYALGANFTGSDNTAIGSHALGCNLYGHHNIGVGFNAVAGNVTGSGNVGLGNFALQTTKKGDFNIAIGHGAGHYIGEDSSYNLYVGAYGVDAENLCGIETGSGSPPLLFGDLQNLKLGVGVKTLHDYGAVQVSGDMSPAATGVFSVGNSNYPWKSVNETIYFSGGKASVGTEWPSGDQGIMTVAGHVVPKDDNIYAIGHPELKWDGYFNDILVSGNAIINDLQYHTINDCLYDCKTLHLATSGLCDSSDYGFHNSAVCGYLSDQALDGAGFEVHSSGYDYRRDYRFIFKHPDPNLTCLEVDSHWARARWESNISIQIESGKHLQTDRVLGDSKLSLATQSGCYGVFVRSYHPSGNRTYISPEVHVSGDYSYSEDINFIGSSGTHFGEDGNPSGYDLTVSYGVVDSGVTVGQKFASRISQSMLGFGLEYHDEISNSGDRLSAHIYNGQSEILEPFTILRGGGIVERSGLVGITNKPHTGNPVLPETIFNVQSSGTCDIRFSSSSGHLDDNQQWSSRTSLELLGNGNTRASGLHISYNPSGDGTSLDQTIIDFSLIKPSGTVGRELGFLSVSESGYVGIGSTKDHTGREFEPNAPLTISHSGGTLSGTVSLREQNSTPSLTTDFGKLYVKPKIVGDYTQSLFFLDDGGNEFDLLGTSSDGKGGHLYGDIHHNTFGGWYAAGDADSRALVYDDPNTSSYPVERNTVLGYRAGETLFVYASEDEIPTRDNTLLGMHAGSQLKGVCNTVVGSNSFSGPNHASGNVVIGYQNAAYPLEYDEDGNSFHRSQYAGYPINSILIGTGLFWDDEITDIGDYTLAIGFGTTPLIKGSLGGDRGRNFSLYSLPSDHAVFSIVEDEHVFSIQNDNDGSRDLSIINIQDTDSALDARGYLSMRFSNSVGFAKTLVDFDPSGTMTNTPSFAIPSTRRPFVAISGDLRLRGDIRFSDGSTLSTATVGDIDFTSLPLAVDATSTNTYVAAQVDTTMSKMSLQSLANYVGSGFASVANNCNLLFSNGEADVDTINNSGSVFIGCDVATQATGWRHSVMMGTQAGAYAATPNVGLDTDTAVTFIGYRAGYDSDNIDNSVFIGTNAGNNADSSSDSIFIGSSAGLNATNPNSIGIGENAMRGSYAIGGAGGTGNIEIVTALLDNQRLMYGSGHLSNRLNIQNSIAGNTSERRVSIGDAVLSPDAPLSVRRDPTITGHSSISGIQTWYDDDVLRAYVNPSGDYVVQANTDSYDTTKEVPANFGHLEGIMTEYIYANADPAVGSSGWMTVKVYDEWSGYAPGGSEEGTVLVVNRDPKLNIHGPGATGGAAYVITARVNGENRPIYVSCSG